jgi:hypothetical protein
MKREESGYKNRICKGIDVNDPVSSRQVLVVQQVCIILKIRCSTVSKITMYREHRPTCTVVDGSIRQYEVTVSLE